MRESRIISLPVLLFYLTLLLAITGIIAAKEQLLDSLEKEMTNLVQSVQPSIVSVVAYCKTPYCNKAETVRAMNHTGPSQGNESLWLTNIGSGCIMDSQGHILTTENVVHDAHEMEVTFSNGRRKVAQLVGSDPESNIAVLRVEGNGFPPAKMGDSNQMKVGSWVTILGNSFGMSSAVSFGLVNGIRKEDELIQMSALVNPGNSGAAALNTKGEVIGLVVAAVSEPVTLTIGAPGSQQPHVQRFDLPSQGASLAIPIHKAKQIASELIEHGTYERGWLGVIIQDLTKRQAEKLGVDSGVLVIRVLSPSPAADAQILEGDVIIEYDGKRVAEGKTLFKRVQSSEIGKIVNVTVFRNGHEYELLSNIAQRPKDLKERMSEGKTALQHNVDSSVATPSQIISADESLEKRIELLEEEIRRLQKLVRKEK